MADGAQAGAFALNESMPVAEDRVFVGSGALRSPIGSRHLSLGFFSAHLSPPPLAPSLFFASFIFSRRGRAAAFVGGLRLRFAKL